jgi:hypothetical protein
MIKQALPEFGADLIDGAESERKGTGKWLDI